jgi:hypothetical protein
VEAIPVHLQTLQLRRDSEEAVEHLLRCVDKTPGKELEHENYVAARRTLQLYPESDHLANELDPEEDRIDWLLPGGRERSKEGFPPDLEFHRIDVMQCVGVAIGPAALMVDAGVVQGAADVYVRIGPEQFAQGTVQKVSYFGREGTAPPLALVLVEGVTFARPVATGLDPEELKKWGLKLPLPRDGRKAIGFTMNCLREMGGDVREFDTQVRSGDDTLDVTEHVQPGESAAPLIDGDGKLMGFLMGRTNALNDGGGKRRFVPSAHLIPFFKKSLKKPGAFNYRGYSVTRPRAELRKVEAQTFVVYGVHAETVRVPAE